MYSVASLDIFWVDRYPNINWLRYTRFYDRLIRLLLLAFHNNLAFRKWFVFRNRFQYSYVILRNGLLWFGISKGIPSKKSSPSTVFFQNRPMQEKYRFHSERHCIPWLHFVMLANHCFPQGKLLFSTAQNAFAKPI